MVYSAFLKQGGTPISFHEGDIYVEQKKSRIVIGNPVNTSEDNNRTVPSKVYLHEVDMKPEHRAEIVNKFRPKTKKKQNAVRPRI